MKLAEIGPVLFVFTFIVGFWAAPIRFVSTGSGSGALTGGNNFCAISDYSSTYFEELSRWSCTFDTESQALDYFESLPRSNTIIRQTDSYLLLLIQNPTDGYYCSIRRDGRFITNICSHSLKHVTQFERQFMSSY
jgi:hypothetical protein